MEIKNKLFFQQLDKKALLFDVDGTLVDNMNYHKQSWIDFFALHQLDLTYDRFDAQYHKGSLIEIMRRLFPNEKDLEKLKKIGAYKEKRYRQLYAPHVKAISGLKSFLHQVTKENIPMGVATMGDQHNIDFIFETLQLHSFFHSTTGGHEVKEGKPHPEIFLTAAKKLGVTPNNCLAFEDTRSGVTAALAAGMSVVGVATMFSKRELLALGCQTAIANYTELIVL